MRITNFLLIALAALVVNNASVVNAQTCPDVKLYIENDTCNNVNKFSRAFEDVYKALYNYIDWYNFYGVAPNSKTIKQLAQTSFAQITDTETVSDRKGIIHSMRGGVASELGLDRQVIEDRRQRFLDVMEGRELTVNCDIYPPLLCKSMGWCCWFCACKTRRNLHQVDRVPSKAILDEAHKMEAAYLDEQEHRQLPGNSGNGGSGGPGGGQESTADAYDVCAWLLAQDLPECLFGATVVCDHIGEFP